MKLINPNSGRPFRFAAAAPLLIAAVVLGATGCERIPAPELKANENIVFPASGGEQTLSIQSNGSWEIFCDADWLHFSESEGSGDGEITLTAASWYAKDPRTSNIELKYGSGEKKDVPVSQDAPAAVMLNESGGANSYIINAGDGLYAINVMYKGNSVTETVGAWAKGGLVWQDAKGLVEAVNFNVEENLLFIAVSNLTGNAVVSVEDSQGNIMWSWHLWIADYDPETDAFTSPEDYGGGSRWTFMNRHIGAISEERGTSGAFGLLYQWGRKDPFTASDDVTEVEKPLYDINGKVITGFEEMASQYGTLELAVRNPMVFYTVTYDTRDWCDQPNDDFWGGITGKKTIYDPCPAGWKIPVSTADGVTPYGFMNRNNTTWIDNGRIYNDTEWWMAGSGTRVNYTGGLNINANSNTYGGVWFGTAGKASDDPEYPELYGQYMYIASGRLVMVNKDTRAQGMSVRCVKE